MPITHSAKKELRKAKKRSAHNKAIKDNLAWLERNFLKQVAAKDQKKAKELLLKLQKAFDKAAKREIIKKNRASRKKSRLTKKLNNLLMVK
jgi:small subunit ribosomal protein S20